MTENEAMKLQGGGFWEAASVFVGTVAVAWSPVVAFACPPAIGVPATIAVAALS